MSDPRNVTAVAGDIAAQLVPVLQQVGRVGVGQLQPLVGLHQLDPLPEPRAVGEPRDGERAEDREQPPPRRLGQPPQHPAVAQRDRLAQFADPTDARNSPSSVAPSPAAA
jgi:hypothetical protein